MSDRPTKLLLQQFFDSRYFFFSEGSKVPELMGMLPLALCANTIEESENLPAFKGNVCQVRWLSIK